MGGISWIKIETTFPSKPVVLKLRRLLSLSRSEVIGNLIRVLCWADGVTSDGSLGELTVEDIDEVVACTGFGAALVSVGWLTETDGVLAFNEWDMHNGENAKRRAMNARAANRYRTKPRDEHHQFVIKKDDERHQNELQSDDLDKIREEKNKKDTNVSQKAPTTRENASPLSSSGEYFAIQDGNATINIPKDRKNDVFLATYGRKPKSIRAFQVEWSTTVDTVDPDVLIECARLEKEKLVEAGELSYQLAPETWLADCKYDQWRKEATQKVTQKASDRKLKVRTFSTKGLEI